ncbi:MAG: hypothetical protein Ta2B_13190 [Termitinemataceae bacterium]|nr:MAG: hypothetical protein Ta2B_13190 [Termitinemataceae bacterium]
MVRKLSYTLIQNRAEKILEQYQLGKLPIDPKKVAEKARIIVQAKDDCTEGVSGMLLHVGDQFGIMYATHLNNIGFENFSIAHELGHFFLDGHPEQIFNAYGLHESHAGFTSQDSIENEADTFAASLLMPSDLFKDKMLEYEKGLDGIEMMAKVCNTSLTATAIRYAELCDSKIVVIVSTNGIVDYCCISKKVFELGDIVKPKRGDKIPKGTAASVLFDNPQRIATADKLYSETDFRDWIDSKKTKNGSEESMGLGRYGKVLTVIS